MTAPGTQTPGTPPPGSQTPQLSSLLHEMWRTRPHRLREQGKIAGVCAGIGYRYGVDPLLVRVVFVVSALFGSAGIPLYLACWLLLPAAGDEVSAAEAMVGRGRSSMSRRFTVVLIVACVLTWSGVAGAPFWQDLGGSGVLGLVLMLGGLYLLHRRQPVPPAPTAPKVDLTKSGTAGAGQHRPPSWDPLGAAPFAWDLPEPSPPVPPRQRSRHTPVTLGIALILVGAAIAVRLAADADWLTPPRIAAIGLAVIGAGLVVGAFRRRGWGLLPLTGPLIAFVLIGSVVDHVGPSHDFGNQEVVVQNPDQLQESYHFGVGNARLDLTGLRLTADDELSVRGGIGNVTVLLPHDVPVTLQCHSGIGSTTCDTPSNEGLSGPTLDVNVHSGIGNVEVHRG